MFKNFSAWHTHKSSIDVSPHALRGYKERDVWWVSIGHNVGFEENGKGLSFARPVLIIKGFSPEIFWGIPLTSQSKTGKYYYTFTIQGYTNPSVALLSQLRVFDTKRVTTKLGMIEQVDFDRIKKLVRQLLI